MKYDDWAYDSEKNLVSFYKKGEMVATYYLEELLDYLIMED